MMTITANTKAEQGWSKNLATFLQGRVGDGGPVTVRDLRQVSEGYSFLTYSFQAEWRECGRAVRKDFVLSREPDQGVYLTYDVRKQYSVLRALTGSDFPAPAVYWMEMDPAVLGKPFYVMEKVEGEVPSFFGEGRLGAYADPVEKGLMATEFVVNLVKLHKLEWERLDLSFLGVPSSNIDFASREIVRCEELYERSRIYPVPMLARTFAWLRRHIVPSMRTTIVHGDYRLGNFIWRDRKMTALLDWETVALGDPMCDLGWVCVKRGRAPSPLVSWLMPRDAFLKQYQELAGITISEDSLRFWEVMACAKLSAILLAGAKAVSDGRWLEMRQVVGQFEVSIFLDEIAKLIL